MPKYEYNTQVCHKCGLKFHDSNYEKLNTTASRTPLISCSRCGTVQKERLIESAEDAVDR